MSSKRSAPQASVQAETTDPRVISISTSDEEEVVGLATKRLRLSTKDEAMIYDAFQARVPCSQATFLQRSASHPGTPPDSYSDSEDGLPSIESVLNNERISKPNVSALSATSYGKATKSTRPARIVKPAQSTSTKSAKTKDVTTTKTGRIAR